jgi:uncharacterized protein
MSVLRQRLGLLLAQAKGNLSIARVIPPPGPVIELRELLAQRRRSALRDLPGNEVAEGVRRIEFPAIDFDFGKSVTPTWGADAIHASSDLVFLDTETTGLAGGSGTKAFLVGLARCESNKLQVTQFLLTRMSGEQDLLRMLTASLPKDPVLVSYNGKSFDIPLLRTRYRMQRLREPFGDCAHLDLLHPIRRRFRGEWENCRLVTAEVNLLNQRRENDLPGSEAPAAWRTFLRSGASGQLMRVLEHNRRDIESLARVLAAMLDSRGEFQRLSATGKV